MSYRVSPKRPIFLTFVGTAKMIGLKKKRFFKRNNFKKLDYYLILCIKQL